MDALEFKSSSSVFDMQLFFHKIVNDLLCVLCSLITRGAILSVTLCAVIFFNSYKHSIVSSTMFLVKKLHLDIIHIMSYTFQISLQVVDILVSRSVWDWIKYDIRSHAISYSKEKAKLRNENERQPLGIKWPMEAIKALGVFSTHDKKLLHLKNFSEKIDDIKKLINIWSSRGLSIYGKVTLIKSLLIPKIV